MLRERLNVHRMQRIGFRRAYTPTRLASKETAAKRAVYMS